MSITEIIQYSGGGLLLLMTLLQIVPIKINPWTWIAKTIGKALNGEVISKLSTIETRVDDNEIDRLRWEILDFANSCRNGRKHTKEEFDHIIKMHEKYAKILKRNELTNGQTTIAFEYIQDIYKRCMIEGFL